MKPILLRSKLTPETKESLTPYIRPNSTHLLSLKSKYRGKVFYTEVYDTDPTHFKPTFYKMMAELHKIRIQEKKLNDIFN